MKSSISALKKDGFTIDGTGYFACHQESHRLLYAKTPWCRVILVAVAFALFSAAAVYGIAGNVPVLALIGFASMVGMALYCAPKKKVKK